jgi:hypothetical protein
MREKKSRILLTSILIILTARSSISSLNSLPPKMYPLPLTQQVLGRILQIQKRDTMDIENIYHIYQALLAYETKPGLSWEDASKDLGRTRLTCQRNGGQALWTRLLKSSANI